jgi:hypothetical protein
MPEGLTQGLPSARSVPDDKSFCIFDWHVSYLSVLQIRPSIPNIMRMLSSRVE